MAHTSPSTIKLTLSMNQFHQFQTNFSGGLRTASEVLYSPLSPISDNLYSPSPPGTRSSTSSSAPQRLSCPIPLQRTLSNSDAGDSIDRKTYSWFPLNKRPRRRYDEIERLYQCSWPDCNKSYGTLNHLNTHVTMQNHGAKRTPSGWCSCFFSPSFKQFAKVSS